MARQRKAKGKKKGSPTRGREAFCSHGNPNPCRNCSTTIRRQILVLSTSSPLLHAAAKNFLTILTGLILCWKILLASSKTSMTTPPFGESPDGLMAVFVELCTIIARTPMEDLLGNPRFGEHT
ncbi:expressed unknown protein [Seminavis robusta]|uniref:Uncharacterized protein n=1 Tax=Seminavis robusta TaxID=568900 RepID=A0A9N8E1J2_9STRA|nr:expressed unknown protein [Seminavis robusta]|eukprot:Sro554_g165551.1  (123) ;mRNA; f:40989-41357